MEKHLINLSQNVNPGGCSPLIKQTIVKAQKSYTHYPDVNVQLLQKKIARHLGIDYNQVLLTGGSSEALELIIKTFCTPCCEVVLPQYAFSYYKTICQNTSLIVTEIANDGYQDLLTIAKSLSINTRFIFLTNPSNPMGTYIKFHDLEIFMKTISSEILVVIDEAYYEYLFDYEDQYQSAIKLVEDYKNLIITRTFSKAYGLAGLRIGYCISNQNAIEAISKLKNPYSVNNLAIIAAEIALDDQYFLNTTRTLNQEGFKQLAIGFNNLNLTYLSKSTNFITLDLRQNAKLLAAKLLMKKIVVKTLDEYSLPNHIRVSVGLTHENDFFLEAIKNILNLRY